MHVFVWLRLISFLLTYRFSDYYFVCAIGGQHNGHLPFWLPGFAKLIMLLLRVLLLLLLPCKQIQPLSIIKALNGPRVHVISPVDGHDKTRYGQKSMMGILKVMHSAVKVTDIFLAQA